jgi:thiol-disulfide isomerase/thioredoxin
VTGIPPGTGRSPTARGMAFALSVLLASAGAGFWVYRLNHRASTYVAPAPAGARPRPAEAPAAAGRKSPERLPALTLPDTSGKPHSLSEWAGRPLMVNFWATWCEPCQREIPLLEDLRREHAGNGLEIVGIAIDSADSVAKYARDHSMGYPILIGERGGLAAAAAFGMDTVLPFTVFADAQGRIVGVRIGELHRDQAELILGLVSQVDENKLTLEAARREIGTSLPRLGAAHAPTGDAVTQ